MMGRDAMLGKLKGMHALIRSAESQLDSGSPEYGFISAYMHAVMVEAGRIRHEALRRAVARDVEWAAGRMREEVEDHGGSGR